eukprot:CAMPEP_0172364850 /NCGR_PEP_ID=MMETSP1060-20121228/7891_1 /TAXON_ID=37318 /ORGANISM="Pseudo-nitzschia pungens, Strain cf. cingulata" /LENGTH=909 /DNA_ID=CAMNT_0013087957 /DNA_START=239 /DNA_END=2968 /DNA_ORIENTATION=-
MNAQQPSSPHTSLSLESDCDENGLDNCIITTLVTLSFLLGEEPTEIVLEILQDAVSKVLHELLTTNENLVRYSEEHLLDIDRISSEFFGQKDETCPVGYRKCYLVSTTSSFRHLRTLDPRILEMEVLSESKEGLDATLAMKTKHFKIQYSWKTLPTSKFVITLIGVSTDDKMSYTQRRHLEEVTKLFLWESSMSKVFNVIVVDEIPGRSLLKSDEHMKEQEMRGESLPFSFSSGIIKSRGGHRLKGSQKMHDDAGKSGRIEIVTEVAAEGSTQETMALVLDIIGKSPDEYVNKLKTQQIPSGKQNENESRYFFAELTDVQVKVRSKPLTNGSNALNAIGNKNRWLEESSSGGGPAGSIVCILLIVLSLFYIMYRVYVDCFSSPFQRDNARNAGSSTKDNPIDSFLDKIDSSLVNMGMPHPWSSEKASEANRSDKQGGGSETKPFVPTNSNNKEMKAAKPDEEKSRELDPNKEQRDDSAKSKSSDKSSNPIEAQSDHSNIKNPLKATKGLSRPKNNVKTRGKFPTKSKDRPLNTDDPGFYDASKAESSRSLSYHNSSEDNEARGSDDFGSNQSDPSRKPTISGSLLSGEKDQAGKKKKKQEEVLPLQKSNSSGSIEGKKTGVRKAKKKLGSNSSHRGDLKTSSTHSSNSDKMKGPKKPPPLKKKGRAKSAPLESSEGVGTVKKNNKNKSLHDKPGTNGEPVTKLKKKGLKGQSSHPPKVPKKKVAKVTSSPVTPRKKKKTLKADSDGSPKPKAKQSTDRKAAVRAGKEKPVIYDSDSSSDSKSDSGSDSDSDGSFAMETPPSEGDAPTASKHSEKSEESHGKSGKTQFQGTSSKKEKSNSTLDLSNKERRSLELQQMLNLNNMTLDDMLDLSSNERRSFELQQMLNLNDMTLDDMMEFLDASSKSFVKHG